MVCAPSDKIFYIIIFNIVTYNFTVLIFLNIINSKFFSILYIIPSQLFSRYANYSQQVISPREDK